MRSSSSRPCLSPFWIIIINIATATIISLGCLFAGLWVKNDVLAIIGGSLVGALLLIILILGYCADRLAACAKESANVSSSPLSLA
jgi:hypothetical protein